MTCHLRIRVHGYSEDEMKEWDAFVHQNAHIILSLAAEGGFNHATAV